MASAETCLKQFEQKINALQELDQNGESGFHREFKALRQASFKYKANSSYSTKAGENPINRVKNRFKDILPFDYSRVQLPTDDNSPSGFDYINANFIKDVDGENAYIASQGPLPNTVNDFWRMLWAYKVKVVVMLCREEENGKKKCQRYWCKDDEEKLSFGGIAVRTERCIGVGNDFVMRTLVAEYQGEKQTITQFHYTAWPDHGVPKTALPLIELIKLVREYQPENSPPIVVHCSAGCGRTGTICALDYTRSLIKEMKFQDLVPYRIVENLRKQRHAMVQTVGQYKFLCWAMSALFREKLDLAIEEDHENHLYENVVPLSPNSDSDSDFTPSSPIFFNKLAPQQQISHKKENLSPFLAPNVEHKPKRAANVTEQNPPSNYVNVAFDLVDLSDSKVPQKSSGAAKPKIPVSRLSSAPDKFTIEKTQYDTSADYVIAPPRETSKTTQSLPTSCRQENVQQASTRPPASSRLVNFLKPSAGNNPAPVEAQKSSSQPSAFTSTHERPAKSIPAGKQHKGFPRTQSASNDDKFKHADHAKPKPFTCGPSIGAKYAGQMKAMNGLQRARVLPSEDTRGAEDIFAEEGDQYVNSGLYASVNTKTKSDRRPINENTFRGIDSVDGDRSPGVPRKSTELLTSIDEQHESTNDAKKSVLAKKIPFLSRKSEVKGVTLEHIGFGNRVPKPKGPRSPPHAWTVKS